MNPLQTDAHLFVGFQVMWPDGTSIWIDGNVLMEFEDWENKYPPSCEPKLIARPIEDMTAEELEMVSGLNAKDLIEWKMVEEEREQLKKWVNSPGHSLSFRHARQLLEIGVLPFPQKLFGDTVIDTRTLTNA